MRRQVVATVVLLATGLACAAYKSPVPPSSATADLARESLVYKPVVGILEPEIRIDDEPMFVPAGSDARTTERQIQQAVHTIDALRGTALFTEVDFSKQLSAPPDLLLTLSPTPPSTADGDAVIPFVFTVGIFPMVFVEQNGVYVTPPNANPIVFDWPTTAVAGWAAPFLLLSPRWKIERDLDGFHRALAVELLKRLPAFSNPPSPP